MPGGTCFSIIGPLRATGADALPTETSPTASTYETEGQRQVKKVKGRKHGAVSDQDCESLCQRDHHQAAGELESLPAVGPEDAPQGTCVLRPEVEKEETKMLANKKPCSQ